MVNRKLKKGDLIWQRRGPVTVCKWKDKREVLTIANMHVEKARGVQSQWKIFNESNIIQDYNQGLSDNDRSDRMC